MEAGSDILVVPAGERWGDGSMRPAVEDLIGAGAIINYLMEKRSVSAEASVALSAYRAAAERLHETLAECSSGRELIERGFGKDVEMAAELNCSRCAPMLVGGAYRAG
jgi:2-phosphosulfolactate phosphatase